MSEKPYVCRNYCYTAIEYTEHQYWVCEPS